MGSVSKERSEERNELFKYSIPMVNDSIIKLKSLQLTVLVFLLSFFSSPDLVPNPSHFRCVGGQQDSPKGKGFFQCVRIILSLAQSWVIQVLKAF